MEGLFSCAAIFTILGGLLLLLHCIGVVYRWVRGMFWSRQDKGMIGRTL
jgi:hypothetical protein